jgi:hypothetical protein
LAVDAPFGPLPSRFEAVARASDITALAEWVRALAPTATIEPLDAPTWLHREALPIRSAAGEPGRAIYPPGPELSEARRRPGETQPALARN